MEFAANFVTLRCSWCHKLRQLRARYARYTLVFLVDFLEVVMNATCMCAQAAHGNPICYPCFGGQAILPPQQETAEPMDNVVYLKDRAKK